MKSVLLLLSLIVVFGGCSTGGHSSEENPSYSDVLTDSQFNSVVDEFTKRDEKYTGFVSAFQYNATLLNSKVLDAQTSRKASDYQWTREELAKEREKVAQQIGNQSQIFLSFFAPVNE